MSKPDNSEYNFPLDVPFMIRLLNEATGTNLRVSRQETFRSVMTIYHGFDRTTEEAANYLVKQIRENEIEFFNEITWKSILALLQTKHEFRIKSVAVNFAIGWLIENSEDSTILNTILMSISLPSLSWNRVVAVRVGIHIYLTRPELRNFFIIRLSTNGYIYMKNRIEIPWKDLPYTVCDICRGINAITDDYCNPTFPKLVQRYDPEASRWKKGKLVQPSPVKSHTELKNPYYKWNFDPNDFPSETPKPIEPRTPQIFGAFSQQNSIIVKSEEFKKSVAVARWLEDSPSPPDTPNNEPGSIPQPVQKMLVKPAGYQKQKGRRDTSVVTGSVSSGYQSLKSSEKATIRLHAKNSQKTPVVINTNKTNALKLVDKEQGERQLEGKQQKNERMHENKAERAHKNQNENDLQSTSNNNNHHRRIPVNHRRLSIPRAQETTKKEQETNHQTPQIKPKPKLLDLIPKLYIFEEPVTRKRGSMEYAEYVQMWKDNTKVYPQPPKRDHGTSKETTPEKPEKPEQKFYFDKTTNILEMN
ncbi:unnamed protein product [Caenorhabditis brenneri]